ncbi:MAG: BlaI/MecI/CopY family transcriptional regulator [Bacteroidales bacterium]|jgi:predicted transcriptional regulator|nr:BlaI/MecI/CopY family transcriptional regulator [Bacteroidales bacterium]
MKKLTKKEEVIMGLFWRDGSMFVRDLLDKMPDPKPHFNTVSTQVRTLETEGFLGHETFGNTYRYHAVVTEDEYRKSSLSGLIRNYFGNSYLSAVSALVSEKKISVSELKDLIASIESGTEK